MLLRIINSDCEILETNGYEQTLSVLSTTENIDLVLVDLFMPGARGIESISNICQTWPDLPVVVVTIEENMQIIFEALKAGVSGYIPKSSTPEVTMSAIRLVMSGGIYLPPNVLGESDVEFWSRLSLNQNQDLKQRHYRNSRSFDFKAKLTKRQIEVLELLVLGMSNNAIAEALGLTPGTVKVHISRIFKTLDVSNRTEAAHKYSEIKILPT